MGTRNSSSLSYVHGLNHESAMLVVGLTGGIGAGKSTVAALFAKYGAPIIDADVIARDLTMPDQPAYQAIIAYFGDDLCLADRTLNRSQLRQIIFNNDTAKRWLENLLHPLIKSAISQQLQVLHQQQAAVPYCIVVLPLLFEANARDHLDRVLLVDSLTQHQINRAAARDQASKAQIQAIVETQYDRDKRLQLADDILINDSSLTELSDKVHKLHEFYCNPTIKSSKSY